MNTPKLQQLQNVYDDPNLYRLQPLQFYCITPPSSPAPQFYSFLPPPPPPSFPFPPPSLPPPPPPPPPLPQL